MMMLISYDIKTQDGDGAKRLRHVANACLDYGIRVQYSVFECEVTPEQWVILKDRLLSAFDSNVDSLRFYRLGKNWRHKVEHHGAKKAIDAFADTLII